jgi:hypothetical protein
MIMIERKNTYSTYFWLFSNKIGTYLIRHIFGFSIKLIIITNLNKLTFFFGFLLVVHKMNNENMIWDLRLKIGV